MIEKAREVVTEYLLIQKNTFSQGNFERVKAELTTILNECNANKSKYPLKGFKYFILSIFTPQAFVDYYKAVTNANNSCTELLNAQTDMLNIIIKHGVYNAFQINVINRQIRMISKGLCNCAVQKRYINIIDTDIKLINKTI